MKATEETTAYWRQQVQAFENSGLKRTAYCAQNQIKLFQLDYWRKKFSKPKGESPKTGWIPLRIKEGKAQVAAGFCLRIGKLEIQIRRGFDRELLAEVLHVVGQAC